MGILLGYWITLYHSISFKSVNSFFLACFALIALIAVFEQNIRDQLLQVKFMSWMSVRDKCIEISLITRSHRLSPSWLTLPSGYSNAQNPAVNCGPGASSVSCESWSSRTGGRDLCLSPRPECSLLGSRSAGARGLGSLCQLVLWQTLSLDHTKPPAICYRDHWSWHAAFNDMSPMVPYYALYSISEASPPMPENITGPHGLFFLLTPLPKDSLWWSLWLTSQTLSFLWGETQTYRFTHILISSWSISSHHDPQQGIPQDSGHVNALLNTFHPHILPISSLWEQGFIFTYTHPHLLWFTGILKF